MGAFGWRRAVGVVATVAAGALAVGVVSATSGVAAPASKSHRDTPMGSQIAKHEGGPALSALAAGSGDDPTSGIQGIDVSRWQGEVDWQYWWDQGKRFAYVKATEGTYNVNQYFGQQYDGSAGVGMTRGAYHFAIPNDASAAEQANYFVDNGGGWQRDGRTLPGVVDLEYNPYNDGTGSCYGKSKSELAAWISTFADTYRQRTGRFPVIYTSTSWWSLCVDSGAFAETSPLWIARYNSEVGTLPEGWDSWTFWQYSNDPIDQNKFAGTSSELTRLADGPAPSAPESVSATGGVGDATVRWQEPRWLGVGGVTKYRVTASPGGHVVDDIPPSARSVEVPGLSGGTTYTFTVRAHSADGPGSVARDRLVGTRVSVSLSPSTITYGSSTRFYGKVVRADSGSGASGVRVTLLDRPVSWSTWRSLTSTTTRSDGSFSFTTKPWGKRAYRGVYLSGSATYMGSTSTSRAVTVRQRVSGSFTDSTVRRQVRTTFRGSVAPNHAGQTIYLQRYSGGRWVTVSSRKLSSSSTYSFTFYHYSTGSLYYRTYKPGHSDHAAGHSPKRKLVVS